MLTTIYSIRDHSKKNGMSLIEVADYLEEENIPYYYISYRKQDVIDAYEEEQISSEDMEVYELAGGYIGFQKGVLWN